MSKDNVILCALFVAIVVAPLQWLKIPQVGLKVSQLGGIQLVGVVGSLYLLMPSRITTNQLINILFISVASLQLPLFISLIYSTEVMAGSLGIARNSIYVAMSLLIYLCLTRYPIEDVHRYLGKASVYGFYGMLLVLCVSMAALGINAIQVYLSAIASGRPNLIQFQIYDRLFSAFGGVAGASSAGRHSVCLYACFAAALNLSRLRDSQIRWKRLWEDFLTIIIPLAFAVSSLSRQATVVAACILAFYLILANRLMAFGIVASGTALILLALTAEPASEILAQKFVHDIEDNPRTEQIAESIAEVKESGYVGVGAGVKVSSRTMEPFFAHNLVINHFHQSGLLGLSFSVFFLLLLSSVCLYLVHLSLNSGSAAVKCSVATALCLYSIPITRMMVGLAGEWDYVSCLAFGIASAIAASVFNSSKAPALQRGALV
ncbi:MAG: hypothetical protein AAGJ40_17395 [Planctomycetota bacterium]